MIKFRHFAKISSNIFHIICQNLIRQFLKVTFNEIFCKLALFLFYGTPAEYIASGNSWWLLWPKCWLETEFDFRFRLRFSQFNQLNQTNCGMIMHAAEHKELFQRFWYLTYKCEHCWTFRWSLFQGKVENNFCSHKLKHLYQESNHMVLVWV